MDKLSRFNISEEAIAFQKGKLFEKITKVFKEIISRRIDTTRGIASTDLDKIMFAETGIKTKTEFVPDSHYFHIYPPRITPNTVIVGSDDRHNFWWDHGKQLTRDAKSVVKGTVDIKNCKVGGAFKEIECVIQMDPVFFYEYKMLPEELAAIYLHEVGHAFTAFEFLIETATTNQLLNSITKTLLETENQEERVIILNRVEKELEIQIKDKTSLSKSEDKNAVYGILLNGTVEKARSSTDSWVYDYKSWEFLADQFSIRHGSGAYLASGLYKLTGSGAKSTRIDSLVSFIFGTLLSISGTMLIPPLGIMFALLFYFGPAALDPRPHDDNVQRLNRMRVELTEQIKNPNVSKEVKQMAVKDIETINELQENMEDTRGVMEAFWDFVRPAKRDARAQYEYQMKMEKLAGNSMFVQAAKLSTLS